MNHDATHCSDYDEKKCPANCYRAELTKDLAERHSEFIGVPMSYASFAGSRECARSYKPMTEEMRMLDQLQDVLKAVEDDVRNGYDTGATSRSFLMVARAVYWLLERRIRQK